MKNVLEWLEERKINDESKVAYRGPNEKITFGQVIRNSRKIGTVLSNVKGTAPIAIISGRNVATIYAYLGIVYSGHAYAPIDGSLPRHRIDLIIETLQPAAIVADADHIELARELSEQCYQIDDMLTHNVDNAVLETIRKRMVMTDPLYVIFTSGSTGKPKGVITSHQSLMCYIDSYIDVMEINQDDILGNQSPLDYIAAIRDIYIPLKTGCETVIIPKEFFMQPDRLFDYMNEKWSNIYWLERLCTKYSRHTWCIPRCRTQISKKNLFFWFSNACIRFVCLAEAFARCEICKSIWTYRSNSQLYILCGRTHG